MREIKFRVWDGKNLWYSTTHEKGLAEFFSRFPGQEYMQFTGLLDKTGKQIFEGDIVSDENGTTAIEWAEGMGAWGLLDSDRCMFMLADCNETMEIVGNIQETPELLTK